MPPSYYNSRPALSENRLSVGRKPILACRVFLCELGWAFLRSVIAFSDFLHSRAERAGRSLFRVVALPSFSF